MARSVICQISKKNNQPAFQGDSSILVYLFSDAMNRMALLDWRHFERRKERDGRRKKKKKIFVKMKMGRIEKIGGMKMCYDFWRVKREGWQLSPDHRVWIDWKYGFGKNQWTRVWPQLKGEGKKSAHVKYDGHKWVYFTRNPSLPFQTFGRLQEKKSSFPTRGEIVLECTGPTANTNCRGVALELNKVPSLKNSLLPSESCHFLANYAFPLHSGIHEP